MVLLKEKITPKKKNKMVLRITIRLEKELKEHDSNSRP